MQRKNTMRYARKSLPAQNIKAIDGQNGIVEAYCSVFNNVDYSGEIIRPGFFSETIDEARTTQKALPAVLWSHNSWEPPVGITTEAEEVLPYDSRLPDVIKQLGGLRVVGQFDMLSEFSRSIFNKIVMGALRKYSIGYYVLTEKYNHETGVVELLKGDWLEWSPVNFAANDETVTVGAKGGIRPVESDEHIYTVRKAADFVDGSFRREIKERNGVAYTVITGKLRATGDTGEASIRLSADAWSVSDAKSFCHENGKGLFIAATKTSDDGEDNNERLADHGARVVAQVSAYVARVEDVKGKRLAEGKAGRVLSEANRNILAALQPDLQSVIDRIQKLLDDTATSGDNADSGKAAEMRKLHGRMLSMQAELVTTDMGVAS